MHALLRVGDRRSNVGNILSVFPGELIGRSHDPLLKGQGPGLVNVLWVNVQATTYPASPVFLNYHQPLLDWDVRDSYALE